METVRVVLYINRMPNGELTGCASNMESIGWPLIKKTVVEVEVDATDADNIAAEINMLSHQSIKIMREAGRQAKDIGEKIQSLREKQNDN